MSLAVVTPTDLRTPPAAHPAYLVTGTLANGLRVAVRRLRPSDRDALADGMVHLSPRSRRRRFLASKDRLTARDLKVLVDQVDQVDHVAVVLVWPRTSCPDILLGDARFVRLPGRGDTADVAVTVADEIQGLGAGRLLVATLADLAVPLGITRFAGLLAPANEPSARMLASAGTVAEDRLEAGVRIMTVDLRGRPHPGHRLSARPQRPEEQ